MRAGPHILDDRPETNREALSPGLELFAANFAELLPALPSSSPVLLSGAWGSGKTTLLLAVENELSNTFPTVWFDAWRYENEIGLLPALMRSIWEATPDEFQNAELRKKEIYQPLWRTAVTLSLHSLPVIASAFGVGFLEPLLTALGPNSLKKDLDAVPTDAKILEPRQDETTKLWKSFKNLLNEAWGTQPLIILIDDLDRCGPESAMALLESIRLLLLAASETNCRFVVALDKEILSEAISKKFEAISSFDGNRYLEKIFPITFAIPVPTERDVGTLVRRFLDDVEEDPTSKRNMTLRDQRDALSEALADPIFANPRLMKRCINRFRLVVALEGKEERVSNANQASEDRFLAKWIAAIERWPGLRSLLLRHSEASWMDVAQALKGNHEKALDKELETILSKKGFRSWLQREMLGRDQRIAPFRRADERLRRWGL